MPPATSRSIKGSHLSGVALFAGVSEENWTRIAGLAQWVTRDAGQLFFKEGDPADTFFVVVSGRVKLTQVSRNGQQVVLRILSAGEAFGAAGAFGAASYPINVEAAQRTEALAWRSTEMRRIFEAEPRIALNALEFVSMRLHDLQRRFRQLTTERVDRRVARMLLSLAEQSTHQTGAGVEIFPITRQDIAEMTGTTLYSVSRLVSAWERRQILRGGRRRLVILDMNALVAIADDLLIL